jgi:hypothetical protein
LPRNDGWDARQRIDRYVWINTGANEVMKDIIARAL